MVLDATSTTAQKFNSDSGLCPYHQLAIKPVSGTLTGGTATIKFRGPDSDVFSGISGIQDIQLNVREPVLYTFLAAEFEITLTNVAGTATEILVTDRAWER